VLLLNVFTTTTTTTTTISLSTQSGNFWIYSRTVALNHSWFTERRNRSMFSDSSYPICIKLYRTNNSL